MTWLTIVAMTLIVFFNRYVFLEPGVPLKIPPLMNKALRYSAPCLLTAICGPIILMDHGAIRSVPLNPYLLASIASVLIALRVRNMVGAVLLSLTVFYAIDYFI